MRVFVSGQLGEKLRVREFMARLQSHGAEIAHDWTRTDDLSDYCRAHVEAGRRAAADINGVACADVYVLLSDNLQVGKGMYVELGAALALAQTGSLSNVFVVGPMNHESIFYHHPFVQRVATDEDFFAAFGRLFGNDRQLLSTSTRH